MTTPPDAHRSLCPINLALEVFGDRWTLLIVRDLMFAGKRHFREFLQSDERIASNILADRLNMLVDQGIVTRAGDPSHKQKAVYSLTERGISLLPVIAQIGAWSRRFLPVSDELGVTAAELEAGGPPLWEEWMARLRSEHLGSVAAPGGLDEPSRGALGLDLGQHGRLGTGSKASSRREIVVQQQRPLAHKRDQMRSKCG